MAFGCREQSLVVPSRACGSSNHRLLQDVGKQHILMLHGVRWPGAPAALLGKGKK